MPDTDFGMGTARKLMPCPISTDEQKDMTMESTVNVPGQEYSNTSRMAAQSHRRCVSHSITSLPRCLLSVAIVLLSSGAGCVEQSSKADSLIPEDHASQRGETQAPEHSATEAPDNDTSTDQTRTAGAEETVDTELDSMISTDSTRMVELKDWKIFEGVDGSFEARWPQQPAHESRVIDGVETHRYHAQANNSMFLLSVQRSRQVRTMDDVKAELVFVAGMLNADIVSANAGPWKGGPAIDGVLTHRENKDLCRCRILSLGDTVFTLCALGESVPRDHKDPVGFFVGFTPLDKRSETDGEVVSSADVDTSRTGIQADIASLREEFELLRPISPFMAKLSASRLPAWKAGAAQEWPEARILQGLAYFYGSGCEPDRAKAFREVEKAAAQNDALAQFCMGWMEMESAGVGDSVKWLTAAAENNEGAALVLLADMYRSGIGVEENPERATELAIRAAELGVPAAEDQLGRLAIAEGRINAAYKHFGKAARAGMVDSQVALAYALQYETGEWAAERRVYWLREAASLGHVQAQCDLATCLQTGEGVQRDREEARHFREMAIAAGSVMARKRAILAEIQNGIAALLDGNQQAEEEAVKHVLAHFRTMQESNLSPAESGRVDAERELERCLELLISTFQDPDEAPTGLDRLRRVWIKPLAEALYGRSSDAYLNVLQRVQ